MSESEALFAALRQAADPDVAEAVEQLVLHAPDHALCRINALDFAGGANLDEERVIAGLLPRRGSGYLIFSGTFCAPVAAA